MLWCQHRGADNRLRRDGAHSWPPTRASFPRASARWTRIPHVGKPTWRRPIGRRSRTRLGRLGQRPSTTNRTPVRCRAATIAQKLPRSPLLSAFTESSRQGGRCERRGMHVVYRVLSARRVSRRSDLLGRECPQRGLKDALQLRGSEQGSRSHFFHPAQPGRFCRLVAIGLGPGRVRSQEQRKPPHLETPSLCSSSTADASRDRESSDP
jgi:hypothetical protein